MNEEEREAKKSFFLKIGVSIIIAIVFFLWAANLKGVFQSQKNQDDGLTWKRVSNNMDTGMKDIEKRINDIQASTTKDNFVKELVVKTDEVASSSISTSTAILNIKKELTDLTASTSTLKSNCPEYINCMPSIGEMRPCVIPAGCEKITQIAY